MSIKDEAKIFILEDDSDQMELLVELIVGEINKALQDALLRDAQKKKLRQIKIAKLPTINSLKKASSNYSNVILAILDCNMPTDHNLPPDDQFIKTNHRITGQHKSVDIVINNLPKTHITMISSMNRFQRTVNRYYEKEHGISINFISKGDIEILKNNIGYYLRKFVRNMND